MSYHYCYGGGMVGCLYDYGGASVAKGGYVYVYEWAD